MLKCYASGGSGVRGGGVRGGATTKSAKSTSANRSTPKNWSKDRPNYLANGNVVVWDGSRFLTVRG